MAVKTDDNAECRARSREYSWDAMNDNAKDCNQEGTSARTRQTLV